MRKLIIIMIELFKKKTLKKIKSINLALVGMSGAGKSYWSKKFENFGFRRFSCDDLIADRLGFKIGKNDKSTLNLAKWMGNPYSKGYLEAESLYLEMEHEVMTLVCDELENYILNNEPTIVDTTGSFIYLKKDLIDRFQKLVTTVHLNIPVQKSKKLFEAFLLEPKPLIWKGKYLPNGRESRKETLKRCFNELVIFRKNRYKLIADCDLDYSFHRSSGTEVEEILEIVTKKTKGV